MTLDLDESVNTEPWHAVWRGVHRSVRDTNFNSVYGYLWNPVWEHLLPVNASVVHSVYAPIASAVCTIINSYDN